MKHLSCLKLIPNLKLLILVLSVLLISNFKTFAQANSCNGLNTFYQTKGEDNVVKIYKYIGDNFVDFKTLANSNNDGASASAYSSVTGLLYVAAADNNKSLKINVYDPSNDFAYIGRVNLAPSNSAPFHTFNNLFTTPDGQIGLIYGQKLLMANLLGVTPGVTTVPNLTITKDVDISGENLEAADYIYYNNKIYGMATSQTTTNTTQLLIIDPNGSNANLTKRTITLKEDTFTNDEINGKNGNVSAYGAVWIDVKGQFYFSNNASGNIYEIENILTDSNSSFAFKSGETAKNDGFACESLSLETQIEVKILDCNPYSTAIITNYDPVNYIYTFDNDTGGISIDPLTGSISGLLLDTDYRITQKSVDPELKFESTTPIFRITTNVSPAPSSFVIHGNTICPLSNIGTITLEQSEQNVNYQLYSESQPIQPPKIGDGIDLIWTGLSEGNYKVIATNNTNCPQEKTTQINTDEKSSAPIVDVQDRCGYSILSITTTGSILWSTGETTPSITVYKAGTYTVVTTENGCTSEQGSGTTSLTLNTKTEVITVTDFCDYSILEIEASRDIFWNTGETTQSIRVNTSGKYEVITENDGCIYSHGIVTVNIKETPALPITLPVNPTCTESTGTITIQIQNTTDTYSFDNGATYQESNTKSQLPTGTYNIIVKNAMGCESESKTEFITDTPCARIALEKTAIFNDENGDGYAQINETITYSFKVTNTGNIPLYNITLSDVLPGLVINTLTGSLSLEPGESNNSFFSATYTILLEDLSKKSVTNVATIAAESSTGKVNATDEVTLLLDRGSFCDIIVYNVITANEDGKNDFLQINGLECYSDNRIEIYNHWGVLVFERPSYNNFERSFKGYSEGRTTVSAKQKLPTGTYFYIFQYKDDQATWHKKSGYLFLSH